MGLVNRFTHVPEGSEAVMDYKLLDEAIKYLNKGFSIIPVGQDKKPLIQWKDFQNRKPTEQEARNWFSILDVVGIGIVTGKISGIVVLDAEAGADFTGLKIPKTPTAISGGGGAHYYFKYPGEGKIANCVRFLPLMDIRADGGFIIAPPSLHASGKQYKWVDGLSIGEIELAGVPKWIKDATSQKKPTATEKDWSETLKGVGVGERNESAASVAGKLLVHLPSDQWESFVWPALKGWNLQNTPPLPEPELRSVFDSIAKKQTEETATEDDKENTNTKAKKLIMLAKNKGIELFHDQFKKTFAILHENGNKILRLNSGEFKNWLSYIAWEEIGMDASNTSIQTAVNMLSGEAYFKGELHELHVRVAWHEDSIWYDLGDGSAVRINKNGWEVVKDSPILFYRFSHQKPQVHPQKGGDLSKVLPFFNLRNPEEQLLLEVMIITSFIPNFPHPVSGVHGGQGAAKSTFHKLLKRLIDPSAIETISPPHNLRELVQTASHHWVIFFDNLSDIPDWLSDTLCRMCTGDGFSKRELYTDDDDIIYSFRLVLGFNGINLAASKPDLLDRSILLALEPIEESKRRQEKEVTEEFEKIKPEILGSIFDLLVKTLNEKDKANPANLPRMADFTCWGCAVARALGHNEKEFLNVYNANINKQHDEAIDANLVATAIMELMEQSYSWEETPTELLEELRRAAIKLKIDTNHRSWPKNPNMVWKRINEIKVNLQAKGVEVERAKSGMRKITMRKTKQEADQAVQSVQIDSEIISVPDSLDGSDSSGE